MNRTVLLTVAAIAVAVSAPGALGTTDNFCRVTISPNFSGGSGPYDNFVTQPGTIDLNGSATGGANSSGNATSHVEYGDVRVTAVADVSLGATGTGYFRDVITITAPGVPAGTNGTLTYTLRVGGSLTATTGYSSATWGLQSAFGTAAFNLTQSGSFRSPELLPSGYTGDPLGDYSATISFQYGAPLQLDVEFHGTAGASNSFTGTGHAEVGSGTPLELSWRGISNVTANGSPVPSFSAASQTGTNWAGPLPAPTCGSADFNCDGDIGTDADISAFFACISGSCPAAPCTNSADFNGDGDIGTDADIEAFFSVLAGGSC